MTNRLALVSCLFVGSAAFAATGISDQQVKSTIDAHMGDIKPCLSPDNGVAGGQLKVAIRIEKDGRVSEATVNKRSENSKIDSCIAKAIKKITFPKTTDGQQAFVSYPFTFSKPKPKKVGTLTEDQIHTAVNTKTTDIQACQADAKKKKADAGGALELGVAVAPDGNVIEIETLSSTTGMAELDNCVIAKIKTVKFPPPTGGGEADFKYPMNLGGDGAEKTDAKKTDAKKK